MRLTWLNRHPLAATLIIQLVIIGVVALVLAIKQTQWAIAVCFGGLAAWLPNLLFALFIQRYQVVSARISGNSNHNQAEQKTANSTKIAWGLAAGEAIKIVISFVLLLVALVGFQLEVLPLIIGWLAVLAGQIITPIMINSHK